jgi:hypothetical protein
VRFCTPRCASGASPITRVHEIIEVFVDREDAERMLRDCLSDEPGWAAILEVVAVELRLFAELGGWL